MTDAARTGLPARLVTTVDRVLPRSSVRPSPPAPLPSCPVAQEPARRAVSAYAIVSVLYVVAALAVTAPGLAHLGSRVIGEGSDPYQAMWSISWVEGWLHGAHGLFFSHQLLFPQGVNLAWTTLGLTTSLVGALLAPLTGLVAAYNAAVLLATAANGTAMYAFARRVGLDGSAAGLCGLVFLASPFFVGQLLGHIQMIGAYGIPLFLSCLWGILEQPRRRSARYLLLGALLAFVAYGSEEYALYAVIGGVIVAVLHPAVRRGGPSALLGRWRGWIASMLVFGLLAAPLLDALLLQPLAAGNGPRSVPVDWSTDLVGFLVPAPWGLFAWLRPSWHLAFNLADGSWFPGFVVWLSIALLVVVRGRLAPVERAVVRVAGVGAAVAGVLSLGPRLHVGGRIYRSIPMPDALLAHLPVVDETLPERLAVLTALFGALLVGAAASALRRRLRPGARSRLVVVGVGVALVGAASVRAPFPTTTARPAPYAGAVRAAGGTVLFVPATIFWTRDRGSSEAFMYVDALTGRPTPEGYVARLPRSSIARINRSPVLGYLSAMGEGGRPPSTGMEAAAARALPAYLAHERVHAVVLFADGLRRPRADLAWIRARSRAPSSVVRYPGRTWVVFFGASPPQHTARRPPSRARGDQPAAHAPSQRS